MTTIFKRKKAFTLIEILIVVVIIGVLAVALFPKLLGALGRTSDEARKAELKNWTTILLQYKNDKNTYPTSTGECLTPTSSIGSVLVAQKYVDTNRFPKDPNTGNTVANGCSGYFWYKSLTANGIADNSFMVVAKMENGSKGNSAAIPTASDKESITLTPATDQTPELYYVELGV